MYGSSSFFSVKRVSIAVALASLMVAGCKSRQEVAIEKAKQQANATGQAQQVISTDGKGDTVTTVIQPLQQGQTTQSTTTTVVPATAPAAAGVTSGPVSNASEQAMGNQGQGNMALPAQPNGAPAQVASFSLPAGTSLAIRIDQHISVKTTRVGEHFSGEVEEPVADRNNAVVVPRGTPVEGIVDAAHRRGHFKGSSLLELRLTTMTLNGQQYPLDTRDLRRSKKGKGRRSAALIGGGSGLGMLIGGVATGGVGLVVGGLAGAGAGTAIGGLTGNRDIEIPAESIVRFTLAEDLVVQVR